MANPTTTRLRKRVSNKPVFHTTAKKLEAVQRVNILINDGTSQTKALDVVSTNLGVSSQTVQNWRIKYEDLTMLRTNGSTPLVQPESTNNTHTNRCTVHSVGLRTSTGKDIELVLEDIQHIARLAGFIN